MNIDKILVKHAAWLLEEGGERADLTGADLTGADLTGADLTGANLRGAKLMNADLANANLTNTKLMNADLMNANLANANLTNANLTGTKLMNATLIGATGIIHPPINDPRGYRCIAVWHGDHWMIAAGCRWFTVDEARNHWGETYDGNREIADAYLRAVEWVANQPAPQEPQA